MSYRVILTPRAKHNLREIHSHIVKQAPEAADNWLDRAERTVDSLKEHSQRCPIAPEASAFGKPIRQLLFGPGHRGTYRLLFEIIGETVYVLHVRRGSRIPLPQD